MRTLLKYNHYLCPISNNSLKTLLFPLCQKAILNAILDYSTLKGGYTGMLKKFLVAGAAAVVATAIAVPAAAQFCGLGFGFPFWGPWGSGWGGWGYGWTGGLGLGLGLGWW
jgi:hypothetical protein